MMLGKGRTTWSENLENLGSDITRKKKKLEREKRKKKIPSPQINYHVAFLIRLKVPCTVAI